MRFPKLLSVISTPRKAIDFLIILWKLIVERRPFVYGLAYLLFIPLFSLAYFMIQGFETHLYLLDAIYFSTVTISTLGYGDIVPIMPLTKIAAATESIVGIVTIGLFLSSLSHENSEATRAAERDKLLAEAKRKSIIDLRIYQKEIWETTGLYLWIWRDITSYGSTEEKYNTDFTFKNMCHMFDETQNMQTNSWEKRIVIYFDLQEKLERDIARLLSKVDLSPWPNLYEKCERLIESCTKYNVRKAIVGTESADEKRRYLEEAEILKSRDITRITASDRYFHVLFKYQVFSNDLRVNWAMVMGIRRIYAQAIQKED